MPRIILETKINAPAEVCFDLMRDIRIHTQTTAQTSERAVAGVTVGMIGLGQTVTFEGRHFGLTQRLTVRVIEFDRPRRFVDAMTGGSFRFFVHAHEFEERDGITFMRDSLEWESPLGIVGRLFDRLFLIRHMRELVTRRNIQLQDLAEQKGSSRSKDTTNTITSGI
ncbi:MAG TPA: SRPBCC family protein [Pyrinomonadaceae bacterium]|nr:SRPBCC family protein [Pyrinomonadaceae bacterium]